MSLSSLIRQLIESVVNSARITSASPEYVNRVEGYDGINSNIDFEDVIRQEVQRIMNDVKQTENTEKNQTELGTGPADETEGTNIEAKIKSNVLKGVAQSKDPIGALSSTVSQGLSQIPIPHAQLVALALILTPIILKELTRDGSSMDLRWKRLIMKEENAFLDRQTQRNTQIGLRQTIIQSRAGFIQTNGAGGNENNIRQIRDGGVGDGNRLSQISITDHSKELFQ